eukprot:sb/3476943/
MVAVFLSTRKGSEPRTPTMSHVLPMTLTTYSVHSRSRFHSRSRSSPASIFLRYYVSPTPPAYVADPPHTRPLSLASPRRTSTTGTRARDRGVIVRYYSPYQMTKAVRYARYR